MGQRRNTSSDLSGGACPDRSLQGLAGERARLLGRYFRTWWQLTRHPLRFLRMADDERSKYVTPKELASASIAIAFCVNYAVEWLAKDPLMPYGSIGTISVFKLVVAVVIFAGTWLLFAVTVPRLIARFRKRHVLESAPFLRLVHDLIYVLMGPVFIFGALLFATSFLIFERVPALAKNRPVLFIVLAWMGAIAALGLPVLIYFFITNAVRSFYKTGIFAGIVLPSILVIIMAVAVNYYTGITRLSDLSVEERSALQRLCILSDLESTYWIENHSWTDDLERLKQVNTTLDDPYDVKLNTLLLKEQAKDYKKSMAGYRYRVLMYRDDTDCWIMAKPLDYSDKTALSFATHCMQWPGIPMPVVKDVRGGDAVSAGSRQVLAAPRLRHGIWSSERRALDPLLAS